MSELRAPDPTLTALADDQDVGYDVAVVNPYEDAATAHIIASADKTDCGEPWEYVHSIHLARWFAVPCRECFPDAPPPGWQPTAKYVGDPDPDLAWQVQS